MDIKPEGTVLIYAVGINYSDLWMQNVPPDQKNKYFCIKAAPKEAKSANYVNLRAHMWVSRATPGG